MFEHHLQVRHCSCSYCMTMGARNRRGIAIITQWCRL